MNILRTLAIPGFLLFIAMNYSYSTVAETEIYPWINYYHDFGFIEDVRSGKYFEPSSFWQQDIKDQMMFLKDEIKECDLINVVSSHYDPIWKDYFVTPLGQPYPREVEERFQDLVYEKLKVFDPDLSKEDFITSLTKSVPLKDIIYQKFKESKPELTKIHFRLIMLKRLNYYERFSETPLLFHFDDYLCPQYRERTEYQFLEDQYETLPSKFEMWLMEEESK